MPKNLKAAFFVRQKKKGGIMKFFLLSVIDSEVVYGLRFTYTDSHPLRDVE